VIAAFLGAVFPVFTIAAIGYLITRKSDLLKHEGMPVLTTQVALPALVLHSLLTKGLPLGDMLQLMLITACCLALGAVLVWLGCRVLNKSPRFYITTLVNPNTGNFGTPLIFALLGPDALTPALIISLTITLSHYTLGVTLMAGKFSWRKLGSNTPLIALALGALLVALDLKPPAPIMQLLDMLGGVALPMLLLLLGSSLASLNLRGRREIRTIVLLSIYRPVSGFLIAFLVTRFAGLDEMTSLTLILQMSMPVAVMSYLLTLRYGGPSERIAALSIISIPTAVLVLGAVYTLKHLLV